jgi:hypothetical protein
VYGERRAKWEGEYVCCWGMLLKDLGSEWFSLIVALYLRGLTSLDRRAQRCVRDCKRRESIRIRLDE